MNAYLVVFPTAIHGYDANTKSINNIHVFDITIGPIYKSWYLPSNCSHCSNDIRISSKYLIDGYYLKKECLNEYYVIISTIQDLRIYLADCQNNGSEVCGQCVATLYSDEL